LKYLVWLKNKTIINNSISFQKWDAIKNIIIKLKIKFMYWANISFETFPWFCFDLNSKGFSVLSLNDETFDDFKFWLFK